MNKKIKLTVLLIFIFLTVNSQKINNLPWIKFDWAGDSLSGRYFDKVAILIPLHIDDLPYKFSAQFDLGATRTMLYENSIKPYFNINQQLKDKIDTLQTVKIQNRSNPTLKNVNLILGNVFFSHKQIVLFKDFGDTLTNDSIVTTSVKQIGTIGPDLFKNKILIIDYPNQRVCAIDKLPESLVKKTEFVNFKINDGRIKIPFQINNKEEWLMFDTGSSIFSLFTNENKINTLIPIEEPIIDSLKISSWGEYYYVYGKKVNSVIKLGKKILPNIVAYYSKKDEYNFYEKESIFGITGNSYFLNKTIIIDYKNNRFGIK